MASQMFAPMGQQPAQQAATSSQPAPSGRFAPKGAGSSGIASTNNSQEDPFEVLQKLKKMLDAGLIKQEQFDAKQAEILNHAFTDNDGILRAIHSSDLAEQQEKPEETEIWNKLEESMAYVQLCIVPCSKSDC